MKKTIGKDIELLLSRFLKGETTLDEERQLTEFFTQNDVPDEYADYKEMFTYFDNGMPLSKPKTRTLDMSRMMMAAAAVAVLMLVATVIYFNRMHTADTVHLTATAEQGKPHEETLCGTTDIDMAETEKVGDAVNNVYAPTRQVVAMTEEKGSSRTAERRSTGTQVAAVAAAESKPATQEKAQLTAANVEAHAKDADNAELERYLRRIEKNSEAARNECRREMENMYAVRRTANANSMIKMQAELEKNGFITTRNDDGNVVIVDNNSKTVAV